MTRAELRLSPEALVAEQARQKKAAAARSRRPVKLVAGPSRKERKALTKKEKNERTAEVRKAVWERASGPMRWTIAACECGCARVISEMVFHMDHWIGGSSREQLTTVDNCWALHPDCDDDKTHMGAPGRQTVADWNNRRLAFCERTNLPFTPRKPTRYYAAHPEARISASEER